MDSSRRKLPHPHQVPSTSGWTGFSIEGRDFPIPVSPARRTGPTGTGKSVPQPKVRSSTMSVALGISFRQSCNGYSRVKAGCAWRSSERCASASPLDFSCRVDGLNSSASGSSWTPKHGLELYLGVGSPALASDWGFWAQIGLFWFDGGSDKFVLVRSCFRLVFGVGQRPPNQSEPSNHTNKSKPKTNNL